MANGMLVVCPGCGRVRKYGKYKYLTENEWNEVTKSGKPVKRIRIECPRCGGKDEKTQDKER